MAMAAAKYWPFRLNLLFQICFGCHNRRINLFKASQFHFSRTPFESVSGNAALPEMKNISSMQIKQPDQTERKTKSFRDISQTRSLKQQETPGVSCFAWNSIVVCKNMSVGLSEHLIVKKTFLSQ